MLNSRYRIRKLCSDRFSVEILKPLRFKWERESIHPTVELAVLRYNVVVYGCIIPHNVEYVEN